MAVGTIDADGGFLPFDGEDDFDNGIVNEEENGDDEDIDNEDEDDEF